MQIGRYQIIDEIGGGGMGRVRLARAPSGRLVVLKNCLRDDPDDDERLCDEARVGLRLQHEGLVETLDLFQVADRNGRQRPFLVTGYVPGVSLLELRRVGALPPVAVCRLGRELASALDALHQASDSSGRPLGVVHRDVTAGNCLLGHDGHARLIDLGIARSTENRALRTETGLLRGTLRYLAPELFDVGRYSIQSDLWALGVVLWEALIGRAAVQGSDAVAVGRICSGSIMILDDHEKPDPQVSRAIARLLAKDPAARPRRAKEAAALFAMVEKSLGGDVDAIVGRVVAAAISGVGGLDVDALGEPLPPGSRQQSTSVILPPLVSPSGAVQPPEVPVSGLYELEPMPQTPTQSFSVPPQTPGSPDAARGLADYKARLAVMERAHAAAWDRQTADDRERLAALPVITGSLVIDEGATVVLELPAQFPMPPMTPLFLPGMAELVLEEFASRDDDDELTLTPTITAASAAKILAVMPLPQRRRRAPLAAAAAFVVGAVTVVVIVAIVIAVTARRPLFPAAAPAQTLPAATTAR